MGATRMKSFALVMATACKMPNTMQVRYCSAQLPSCYTLGIHGSYVDDGERCPAGALDSWGRGPRCLLGRKSANPCPACRLHQGLTCGSAPLVALVQSTVCTYREGSDECKAVLEVSTDISHRQHSRLSASHHQINDASTTVMSVSAGCCEGSQQLPRGRGCGQAGGGEAAARPTRK